MATIDLKRFKLRLLTLHLPTANRYHLPRVGSALRADLGVKVQIGLRPVQRCKRERQGSRGDRKPDDWLGHFVPGGGWQPRVAGGGIDLTQGETGNRKGSCGRD